jgi:hypothetical protein
MLWNQFLDDGDRSFVFFQTNYLLCLLDQIFTVSAWKFDFGVLIDLKKMSSSDSELNVTPEIFDIVREIIILFYKWNKPIRNFIHVLPVFAELDGLNV